MGEQQQQPLGTGRAGAFSTSLVISYDTPKSTAASLRSVQAGKAVQGVERLSLLHSQTTGALLQKTLPCDGLEFRTPPFVPRTHSQ